MAPILIDRRGLRKLGFIAVLVTLFAFAGGFLLGYQQATVSYATDSDIEQQTVDIAEAGEETDVNQPETAILAENQAAISTVDERSAAEIESINASNISEYEKQIEKSSPAIDMAKGMETSRKVNKQEAQAKPAALLTTDEAPYLGQPQIKFSIQVGIYGRLINAQNVKRKLQSQHLAAYVSDSLNKKNKFRYNVRFGYFVDKKSALTALNEYKNIQKGDGYLVNYSAKNIINSADADNIEPVDNESTSATGPVDVMQDKVLPSDNTKTPDVLTRSQD